MKLSSCSPAPRRTTWALMLLAAVGLVAACADPGPAPAVRSRAASAGLELRQPAAERITLSRAPDQPLEQGAVFARFGWGAGPAELGRAPRGSRPGPMALAAAPDGSLYVLDQVNRRVLHLDRSGNLAHVIPIASETTETLPVTDADLWLLELVPGPEPRHTVARYTDGRRVQEVPLARSLDLVTGLFAQGAGRDAAVWVEQKHDVQTMVVAPGYEAIPPAAQRRRALGRPDRSRPGERLSARRTGSHEALVLRVRPGDRVTPLLRLKTPLPLVGLHELDTDAEGTVYLGLHLATEAGPPSFAWTEVARVVVAYSPQTGAHRVVGLAPEMATDAFRPLAIGPGGAIYQLHTTDHEAVIRRWAAPTAGGAR